MPKAEKQKAEEYLKYADQVQRDLNASLIQQVLNVLGVPSNLHTVQVRHLWDDRFRLNVLVGPDATSATVAHSYFLAIGGDGLIVESTPPITKRYGLVARPTSSVTERN